MKTLTKMLLALIILISIFVAVLRLGCFAYPKDYNYLVREYSKRYEVDNELVFSVIKAESNFDKNATSKKGAIGLMQIMPQTGKWVAENIGMENYSPDLLYEPEINIEIGCYYLSYLIDLYENDTICALCAYNAGPSNVDKWLKNGKIDKIDFPETEKYVREVTKNIKIYDFLY